MRNGNFDLLWWKSYNAALLRYISQLTQPSGLMATPSTQMIDNQSTKNVMCKDCALNNVNNDAVESKTQSKSAQLHSESFSQAN